MKELVRYQDPNEFFIIYINFPGQHVPEME